MIASSWYSPQRITALSSLCTFQITHFMFNSFCLQENWVLSTLSKAFYIWSSLLLLLLFIYAIVSVSWIKRLQSRLSLRSFRPKLLVPFVVCPLLSRLFCWTPFFITFLFHSLLLFKCHPLISSTLHFILILSLLIQSLSVFPFILLNILVSAVSSNHRVSEVSGLVSLYKSSVVL